MQLKLGLIIVQFIFCEFKSGDGYKYVKIRQTKFENEILNKVPFVQIFPKNKMSTSQRAINYQEQVFPNEGLSLNRYLYYSNRFAKDITYVSENCMPIIDEIINLKRSVQCKPRETIIELPSHYRVSKKYKIRNVVQFNLIS